MKPALYVRFAASAAVMAALLAIGLRANAHSPANGHTTTTTITCAPNPVTVNSTTTCTLTVTDIIGSGQDSVPVGTVNFTAVGGPPTPAATSCTLAPAGGFSASCTVTYTPTAAGTRTLVALYPLTNGTSGGTVHRWGTSTGNTTLTVRLLPPTVSKSFSLASLPVNGTATLTVTLTNPNAAAITGAAFTDTYPAGLVNASPSGAATTCGGTVTAAAGSGSLQLSGGTIPASGSCTVSANVTTATASSYTNTLAAGSVTATNAASSTSPASATIVFMAPLTVTKAFAPATITTAGTSTLTITLSNPNAAAATGVNFADSYPAGLTNSGTPASPQCNGTVNSTAGSLSLVNGTISAGSSCTVTATVASAAAGTYNNSTGPVNATNTPSAPAATASLTVTAAVGAFDAFEASVPAWSAGVRIKTKLSGASFSLNVVALDAARTAVQSTFSGNVTIALLGNTTTAVALDGQMCPTSSTTIADSGYAVAATLTNGVATVTFPAVSNAWRDVRVQVTYSSGGTTVVACSADNFAIRPSEFILAATDNTPQTPGMARTLDNVTASAGVVHKAGRDFTISAEARNSAAAVTTNYTGSPGTVLSACAGTACTASFGNLTAATAFTAGALTTNAVTYDDAGSFALVLRDTSFADVDLGDSSNAERYIESPAVNVGRFVPDHFTLTAVGPSSPSLTTRSAAAPACAPASTFTYMGESMRVTFELVARNFAGGVTARYTGALAALNPGAASSFAFGAIDPASAPPRTVPVTSINQANPGVVTAANHGFVNGTRVFISGVGGMTAVNDQTYTVTVLNANQFSIGVDTTGFSPYLAGGSAARLSVESVSGGWAAGIGSFDAVLRFERGGQPDGPFNTLGIGIAPTDADGVTLQSGALNLDADNDATPDRVQLAATQVRFGRLRMTNAYGAATLDLSIPLAVQYYNGTYFVTNAADNCTRLDTGNVALSNFSGALSACETGFSPAGAVTFTAGRGNLRLGKPGQDNAGSVDLRVNLDTAGGSTCNPAAGAATGAGQTFLRGNWGSGTYGDDPQARATFGIYRKASEFIYFREMY